MKYAIELIVTNPSWEIRTLDEWTLSHPRHATLIRDVHPYKGFAVRYHRFPSDKSRRAWLATEPRHPDRDRRRHLSARDPHLRRVLQREHAELEERLTGIEQRRPALVIRVGVSTKAWTPFNHSSTCGVLILDHARETCATTR